MVQAPEVDSQQLLQDACNATETHDSTAWRQDMYNKFLLKFGKAPYDWQMDVAEALVLKVDCLCIVLQEEQAARFRKMGITATTVNKETWNVQLKMDIKDEVITLLQGLVRYRLPYKAL
ncbi:hypothetical protein BDQ17DRAFT_1328817 [Cyathus striatus]|nr:hypothetical protein BDQ17DRAFT_1328817 [Cyathus striatus]